jgi:hypothetical protein
MKIFEPDAFKLCPRVPALLLPWRLTSEGYFPSRVTLVLFSAINNCIMAPIVEELFKARILIQALKKNASTDRLNGDMRKNDANSPPIPTSPQSIPMPDSNSQAATIVENKADIVSADRSSSALVQPLQQRYLDIVSRKWVTIRTYVIFMLAASLGLKVIDNTRRILLYTHPHQRHKSFFAVASIRQVEAAALAAGCSWLAAGRGHAVSE